MKKNLTKGISFLILTIIVLLYTNIANIQISKATENNEVQVDDIFERVETDDLKSKLKRSTYNSLMAGTTSVDSTYNLSKNYNLIVKNQQKVGSCWAFAYSSMIESTIKNNKEYSPMHIEYKTAEMFNRKAGEGGNFSFGSIYTSSGAGPVYESDFPFESVYNEETNSEENSYLTDVSNVDLSKYSQSAVVKDSGYFPSIYKKIDTDSATITYANYDMDSLSLNTGEKYTEDEVNAIRTLIKKHIKENGGVAASFYSDIGRYYNAETYSYYGDGKAEILGTTANHAVTIVGWDDSYSKENFLEEYRPIHDGAYIVLNSYGEEFGDNGYFYVSYDDYAIEQMIFGISKIEEVDENVTSYRYQYDDFGANTLISPVDKSKNSIYGANVFSRQDKTHVETLSEVGLTLLETEGVEIYVNATGDDLNSAKKVATYTGDQALEAGYHVVQLSSPVSLTGDKFAVIVKYINTETATVPVEDNLQNSEDEDIKNAYKNVTPANSGEGFVSLDGSQWIDITSVEGYESSNACIKAFTVQGDERVFVTGVELDKTSMSMQVKETANLVATIKPANAQNKNVKWTSSNESVAKVSEDGIIEAIATGDTTITVTTEEGNFPASCKITVTNAEESENDIYKDESSSEENSEGQNGNSQKLSNGQSSPEKIPQTGTKHIVIIIIALIVILLMLKHKNKKYKEY